MMADPRDIALAIRLKSSSTQNGDEREREMDRMEDIFDEIGMEYMDESSLPEDDDERRMSLLPLPLFHIGSGGIGSDE